MYFHTFQTQEERRAYGGSDFLELQSCTLPLGTALQDIVSPDRIHHWKNDSLYLYGEDSEAFLSDYEAILKNGVANDLESETPDLFGINYYSPKETEMIKARLKAEQPPAYEILLDWLENACNGFYLLGL